jgi:Spy/CpxP family protein refolding chaperone
MMKMKRILFAALAVALLASLTVSAGGDEKMKKLKADLNLTDAQVAQLEARFKELDPMAERYKAVKAELTTLEQANPANPRAVEAKKNELASVKKEWKERSDAVYRSVLTSEQWTKLQAMRADYDKKQRPTRNN